MIQSSSENDSTRRILTFPAVQPSDDVSPSTLLTSLTTLASKITSYKTQTFTSNKLNVQESIRFVSTLLDVFTEMELESDLPESVVLALSELHLVFQKMAFLLEDLVKAGCRIWMLMKSELVASCFGDFMKSIATAIDVMEVEQIDQEVREVLEMVARQARRATVEVEPADRVAVAQVRSTLDRFRGKEVSLVNALLNRFDAFELDRSELGFVAEYLGIENWNECDSEIKFLDSELGFQDLNLESGEVVLLSGLIGLMSYCRVLMFDIVDENEHEVKRQSQIGGNAANLVRFLKADDFRCPITLEIMSDPVTVATGQTYDRSSISKWLMSGNSTCPISGEKLLRMDLVPNYALKKLIKQYSAQNGICVSEPVGLNKVDVKRTVYAGCAAAEGALKRAGRFLVMKLSCGRSWERNKAAFEIRLLTRTSIFNRSCMAEAGAIPHLLDLLGSGDAGTQENAVAALLNLSKHGRSKSIIVEYGGLSLILDVLKMGMKVGAKQHAAAVLFYLSSVDEYRQLIGETPEAIPALVEVVRDGNKRSKKNALIAIFGLLMHQDNRWRVLKAGAVPLLIDLLNSPDSTDLASDCLSVLSILSEEPDSTFSILRRHGLKVCAKVLHSGSKTAMEYSVSTLLNLCLNGGRGVVAILANDKSLISSLYSIVTDGSSRESKKASSLIRMLHEFHERNSSSAPRRSLTTATSMPEEQFVHAC